MRNNNYALINANIEKLESSFIDGLLIGFTLASFSLFALYLASRVQVQESQPR